MQHYLLQPAETWVGNCLPCLPSSAAPVDTLAGAKWFCTLDLKSDYWQVEVHKDDREKTAFCTCEGLFQFNVMPFGLCNATATFQRLMDMVLKGLLWNNCLVYIDDIIIVGRTFEQHLNNLAQVFDRLEQAGLKLQPHKCHLLQSKVQFLVSHQTQRRQAKLRSGQVQLLSKRYSSF